MPSTEATQKALLYTKDYQRAQQKAIEYIEDAVSRGKMSTYAHETDKTFRKWLHTQGYRTQILNCSTLYIYWGNEKPMSLLHRFFFNL